MVDNPLWAFSLLFYREANVATACLALQDEAGADVNLVLLLLWCAATGRTLDATRIATADASVAAWRGSVIEPLRRVRRAMKVKDLLPMVETQSCRETVKAIELEAERLSQAALVAGAPSPSQVGADISATAEDYLALYARYLGRRLPDAPLRALLTAFAAAC